MSWSLGRLGLSLFGRVGVLGAYWGLVLGFEMQKKHIDDRSGSALDELFRQHPCSNAIAQQTSLLEVEVGPA